VNLRLSAAVGVVLGVVSLVALVVPAVTTFLPASDELVVVFGGLLVLGGVREVWRRRHFEPGYAETPDTEEPVELPTPGDEFDRQVGLLSTVLYSANVRTAVREEVIEIAVQTLQRRFDDTESEARTALREGTWTEDPFAAATLEGSHTLVDPGTVPVRHLVRAPHAPGDRRTVPTRRGGRPR
jgi:hypothetical protein